MFNDSLFRDIFEINLKCLLSYRETPVQDISAHPWLRDSGVRVLIKREDLNHDLASGNKWWKLKYNLEEAVRRGYTKVLTFGGAYSNHIWATAATAKSIGLNCIGIIRGEESSPLNHTLRFAVDHGMVLRYMDRQTYRAKESVEVLERLRKMFGPFYLIPEGGTNELAVKGCEEFGKILNAIPADYICLPVGTGGTMAGIIRRVAPEKIVLGISVLKNGDFLNERVKAHLKGTVSRRWEIMTEYAYGGYAKRNETVTHAIKSFRDAVNLPLDFVYTGKMMCAVVDMIGRGDISRGTTVLAVHTGGLQGGFNGA